MEQVVEKIVRKVLREELASIGKHKTKIELVNGKWIGISADQREAWGAAYGAVDLNAELARAAAWCVSNPSLAPKSQIGRFLNTWLTREQNRLSLRSIPVDRKTEVAKKICEYCGKPSTGAIGGWNPCDEHWQTAMDGVRPMASVRRA